MELKFNENIAVVGQTQTGKTFLAKYLIKMYARYFIYDHTAQFSDGSFGQVFYRLQDINFNLDKIVYNPLHEGLDEKNFDNVMKSLWFKGYNRLIVVDEIQDFIKFNTLPPYFKKFVFQGRHHHNPLMIISQRPSNISQNILTQCRHFFIFRLTWRDADVMSSELPEGAYDEILNLQNYYFVYFKMGNREYELNLPVGARYVNTEQNEEEYVEDIEQPKTEDTNINNPNNNDMSDTHV